MDENDVDRMIREAVEQSERDMRAELDDLEKDLENAHRRLDVLDETVDRLEGLIKDLQRSSPQPRDET